MSILSYCLHCMIMICIGQCLDAWLDFVEQCASGQPDVPSVARVSKQTAPVPQCHSLPVQQQLGQAQHQPKSVELYGDRLRETQKSKANTNLGSFLWGHFVCECVCVLVCLSELHNRKTKAYNIKHYKLSQYHYKNKMHIIPMDLYKEWRGSQKQTRALAWYPYIHIPACKPHCNKRARLMLYLYGERSPLEAPTTYCLQHRIHLLLILIVSTHLIHTY